MIHFYYKTLFLSFAFLSCCTQHLFACVVTLVNDSSGPILVIDHVAQNNAKIPSSIIFISKGTSRRLGQAKEHAHFTVYTKQSKSNVFTTTYNVKQNECGKNGNPQIKLSDIKNGTGETDLFTIAETSQHHASMVRQLPSMQRADIYKEEPSSTASGCSRCSMAQ
jgi:hypothetical protein